MNHDPKYAACPRNKITDLDRIKMKSYGANFAPCACPASPPASISGIEIVPDESVPDGELRFVQADSEVEQIRARHDENNKWIQIGYKSSLSDCHRDRAALLRIIDRQANAVCNDHRFEADNNPVCPYCRRDADLAAAQKELAAANNKIAIDKITMDNFLVQINAAQAEIERLRATIERLRDNSRLSMEELKSAAEYLGFNEATK